MDMVPAYQSEGEGVYLSVKMAEGKDITLRVVIDFVVLFILIIPATVFKFGVYPFRRGFYCDDESINHPFKESTISTLVLFFVGFFLPFVSILFTELFLYIQRRNANSGNIPVKTYTLCNRKTVHPYLVFLYQTIGPFMCGAAICQSTTDLIKYSVGRLRPHFLQLCQPNWSTFSCTDANGLMVYIEADVCTNTDEGLIKEARLSHVSGHASFSVYTMVYLALYIQARMKWRGSRLLKVLLQVVVLYMALYTCLSRISDYKHHWSDVLGGGILGLVISLLVVFFISNLFKTPRMKDIAKKVTELHTFYKNGNPNYGSYNNTDNSRLRHTELTQSQQAMEEVI